MAEALDELPGRTRTAFEMHRLGGQTLQSVAAKLGISTTLTHQLIHQALAHCLRRLEEEDCFHHDNMLSSRAREAQSR